MRPASDPHIAVVDVETTGLSPWRHDRIVEIAVVLISPEGDVREEYATLLNPGRDVGPTRIHGITASDVVDAPRFGEIVGDVVEVLRKAQVLAGHNIGFDRNFLISEFKRIPAQFPEVPLLCTCTQLGCQSLAACCEEFDIVLDDVEGEGSFHSALFDARATAKLVSRLLSEDPELVEMSPSRVQWPKLATGRTRPFPRRIARRSPSPPDFLQRLACRSAHDTDGPSPKLLTYLGLLDRVLEDRLIEESEEEALLATAEQLGLSKGQVTAAHESYLQDLMVYALADGVISDRERADLQVVADLLGVDVVTFESLPARTRTKLGSLERRLIPDESLEGKRVCFTGELQADLHGEPITRAMAHRLAEQAGLVVANSVTKELDLLVTSDPNSQSGKAGKARKYGTRIVAEAAFWRMLGLAVG